MRGFADFLSRADWLDAARVRRIAVVMALTFTFALAADIWLHMRMGVTNAAGEQLGRDFVNYWAGGHLAAQGAASRVYDIHGFLAWQRAHTAANAEFKWFSYPPMTLLFCLPLAGLGFVAGYGAWLVAGTVSNAALLSKTLGWRHAWLAALAAPAAYINAISGQNGAFTAALVGAGLLLLEERPLVAGIFLGALCIKPQLALLVPVALAAGGYWRAFFSSGVTALALCALSLLLFGEQSWIAFLHNAPLNGLLLENSTDFWHRMPTIFAAARLLGTNIAAAWIAQAISALGAAALVALVWRVQTSLAMRGATLIFATFLATPYAWDYDMIWLTFAVAWMAHEAMREGFRSYEKFMLALTMTLPLLLSPIGKFTGLQIAPLVLWLMLALAVRRALPYLTGAVSATQPI